MTTLQEHSKRYYATMPHIYDLLKYIRAFVSTEDDRWGTLYITKDIFRTLVKLEIYEH
jgi:hypothetical protein